MPDLQTAPLIWIFLIGLAVMLAAGEVGRWFGVRAASRGGKSLSTLESAVLGLLALIVGFTFAMALSRFEAKRDGVLNEANSIGTTALRARLLPEPHRGESLKLLKDYLQIRLDLATRIPTPDELKTAVERSNSIQEALWQQVKAIAAKDNALVPTGLYIQTLNEMIDNQGKRLSAVRNRLPYVVVLGLFGVAAVAMAFTGYGRGLDGSARFPGVVMSVLITAVILLIMDLDRPNDGFIAVSQQPMIDTAKSIAGFKD